VDVETVAEAVCRIPMEHGRGPLSPLALLENSGYFESHETITEEVFSGVLLSHPEWIESWWAWSGDKRVSEGWYLLSPPESFDGKHWVVGYYPEGKRFWSPDGSRACAYFIKHEAEGMRLFGLKQRTAQ